MKEVTPYIHVFVQHLGFYLERYGSLEKFANYSTETQHYVNKLRKSRGYGEVKGKKNEDAVCNATYVHRGECYDEPLSLDEIDNKWYNNKAQRQYRVENVDVERYSL